MFQVTSPIGRFPSDGLSQALFQFLRCILVVISFSSTLCSEELAPKLTIEELNPDLFVVTHAYPWPANSLVAIMENGEIVLVDVPYTPDATDILLNWIDKKYGKRTITAINTHFHVDRLGGNAALVKRGIPIYGSELTAKAIKTRGDASLKLLLSWISDDSIKNYYRHFTYVPPTNLFDAKKGLVLTFGKDSVVVRFPGVGHSIDNLVVYFPAKKTIFGGCMILASDATKPGNVSDGDKDEWRKAMEVIDTAHCTIVIPGHGKPGGIGLIAHTKAILNQ
jgi:metallo-beta-lactamase class B